MGKVMHQTSNDG